MKTTCPLLALLATLALTFVFSSPGLRGFERPNIIFLLADDLAAGAVGYSGNPDVITPHLDRLAQEGVRFLNHYDTTAICMASRGTVMTGLYEYRHGANFSHGDLERRFLETAYPARLREAGYYTGFAGKIGFELHGEKFAALAAFFDEWAGGPGQTFYETAKNPGIARYAEQYPHCSRAYGAWAQDFLKTARRRGKPFCLSISFKAPHLPFTPDPADLKLYVGKTLARPPNYGVAKGAHLSPQARSSRAANQYREWITDFPGSAEKYYALVTGIDTAVGMIRTELTAQGLDQNTVIIFTSDNGYNAGAHGFGDKVLPYEEASRAPLIIFDPRLPAASQGRVCAAVTGNIDLAATLCAIAGAPAPAGTDGKNLLPLVADPAGTVRDFLPLFNFWGTASAQSMAIVTRDWKYIYWYYGEGMQPTEELFHLTLDRYEMSNVAADPRHSAVLANLRGHYDTQLAQLTRDRVAGHGYENYPVLFSRTIPWDQKAALVRTLQTLPNAGEGEASPTPKAKRPSRR